MGFTEVNVLEGHSTSTLVDADLATARSRNVQKVNKKKDTSRGRFEQRKIVVKDK